MVSAAPWRCSMGCLGNSSSSMKPLRHDLITLVFFLGCGALQAQTTISWDFGTATGSIAADVNVPVTNLTISNISSLTGQTLTNASSSVSAGYSGASGGFNGSFAAVSGAFNSVSSSAFVFTLTPTAGYQVAVTNISLGSRSTASGPTALTLRTSVDGFSANTYSTIASANSAWSFVNSGTLTSITGTNSSPLTLRLYGSGGSSAAAGNWRIDDLSVTLAITAVPVPEPSTYAVILGGIALAGVMIRKRRQQRAA